VHVTVTTTDNPDDSLENSVAVGEEMERWLRDLEGFEGLVVLVSEGKALGLAFWETRELAERHSAIRAEFRERMLTIAGATIEDVSEYELAFARLGPALASRALEPLQRADGA
jgi:hypothetical protein